jgi:DUF1680 family protein
MVATRTYLTGGLGSRHKDESFGDPLELPPDRAYTETCAAIASVMLGWRLLLATGDPAYADAIERAASNGVLAGIGLDGASYFYVNPLQRRTRRAASGATDDARQPWFACACCPPNLMRLFSSWEHYLATSDARGIQLHQYAPAEISAEAGGGRVRLSIETAYPWDGRVAATIVESPGVPWTLALRVPAWCRSARLQLPDGDAPRPVSTGMVEETRAWAPGDRVVLELDMPVRVTEPDPGIDAVRGCLALERGPLVYCVETADVPAGTDVEQLELDPGVAATVVPRPDIAESLVGLAVPAFRRQHGSAEWPYGHVATGDAHPLEVGAVPYFAWANRDVGAMRVWIPRHEALDGGAKGPPDERR